jgi:hypothetical protein
MQTTSTCLAIWSQSANNLSTKTKAKALYDYTRRFKSATGTDR